MIPMHFEHSLLGYSRLRDALILFIAAGVVVHYMHYTHKGQESMARKKLFLK